MTHQAGVKAKAECGDFSAAPRDGARAAPVEMTTSFPSDFFLFARELRKPARLRSK